MARKKGTIGKRKSSGYGYVGMWTHPEGLGWCLPPHLLKYGAEKPANDWHRNEPLYLCKITVQMVKDKNGRPIVRYHR